MLCDRILGTIQRLWVTRMIKTYREMRQLESFEDRFRYLSLKGQVGESTFGFDRHINQKFYRSAEWKHIRNFVITRDLGCDLGVAGHELHSELLIHHMNPMQVSDIIEGNAAILDPNFLITTSKRTHNAIHFGDERLLAKDPEPRTPGDTRLW